MALHGLAETNEPSHAGANSGRPTPTASGSSARRRCYRREDPDGRRTVAGYKRRPCTDGCRRRAYNSSNLQAAVQHNADKEKEKAVEANLWTRVSTPCQTWRRSRLLLPRLARPVAQNKNSVEKEKASVMALLRHVHLSCSVASDEKLLETSHCLGTGGPAASRHRGGAIGQGRKYGRT